jgi:hypothetical protein
MRITLTDAQCSLVLPNLCRFQIYVHGMSGYGMAADGGAKRTLAKAPTLPKYQKAKYTPDICVLGAAHPKPFSYLSAPCRDNGLKRR